MRINNKLTEILLYPFERFHGRRVSLSQRSKETSRHIWFFFPHLLTNLFEVTDYVLLQVLYQINYENYSFN